MQILGVDPSTTSTGYGIIQNTEKGIKLVTFGTIKTPAKQNFHLRLKKIYDDLTLLIQEYKPEFVSLEDVFYSQNIKTALKIGHARGAVIIAAANQGIPVYEYSPREIKQSVTGIGSAAKEQVQSMVQRLLHLDKPPAPFDASDALAIAICHLFRSKVIVNLR